MKGLVTYLFLCLLLIAATAFAHLQEVGNSNSNNNLDLPVNGGSADSIEEDAAEIIHFYGQQFEGDTFVFCVDRSGSMSDHGELARAKREICRNIMEFSNRTEFAVCFFDSVVRMWPPNGRPIRASTQSRAAACRWVGTLSRGSQSCPQEGLVRSLQTLNRSQNKRRCLVYVGDGGGTCIIPGWRDRYGHNGGALFQQAMDFESTYLEDTLKVVRRLNYKDASINTIGVMMNGRRQIHHNFVRNLAQQNDGTYRRID